MLHFICVKSRLLFGLKEDEACFRVFNPKCGSCYFWSRTKEGDDLMLLQKEQHKIQEQMKNHIKKTSD
jgi:uncharacterized protein involved in tolerance to divalent cations